jgi:hypothetical protein
MYNIKNKEILNYLLETNSNFRIITNVQGKNLVLLEKMDNKILLHLNKNYSRYIQEIIIEEMEMEDKFIINEIKRLCKNRTLVHRNYKFNKLKFDSVNNEKEIIALFNVKPLNIKQNSLIINLDFYSKDTYKTKNMGLLDYLIEQNIEKNKYSFNKNINIIPSGINSYDDIFNKLGKINFNTEYYNKLIELINTLQFDTIYLILGTNINEHSITILSQIFTKNIIKDNIMTEIIKLR